jgi:heavy metal translocating P-type ATPase
MRGDCAHCGLPLGRRPTHGTIDGEAVRCCCFGCLLALQVSRASGEAGHASSILVRLGVAVFFAMNAMMVSMPSYVPQVYGEELGPTDGPLFHVLRWLAALFATPVLALLGWPVLASGWRGVRAGAANADGLIALAVLASYGLSFANLLAGRPQVYFETATMLLVLVTLGRYLEARARADAGDAVRVHLAPAPARAVRLDAGRREEVDPQSLAVGDVVAVAPGSLLPTDGVVLAGRASVDESALTGESWPTVKSEGSTVAGGTCCIDGALTVRVTAPAAASAAARIEALLSAARRERSPSERLADRLAAALVPAVLAIAVLTGAYWTSVVGLDRGILTAVAVLVVACPCGLGIATPAAVWTGLAEAARRGAIVRSAVALERLSEVGRVLFDKTGTLTERLPRVIAIDVADDACASSSEVLAHAAALELGLHHPLARAVTRAASERGLAVPEAAEVRALAGCGVEGIVRGEAVVVGSARLARGALGASAHSLDELHGRAKRGASAYVVAGGRLLGAIRFSEALAPQAREAVDALRAQRLRLGLLSGDTEASPAVRELLGEDELRLGLSPEEKVGALRRAAREPGSSAVAMVGEGINDAPALAAADVGIAIADATDLARTTADVVLIGADLRVVPWLFAHARRVRAAIRKSLGWAFAYNAVAVVLAASGRLSPLVASLAMIASSAAVVAHARRLASSKERRGVPADSGSLAARHETAADATPAANAATA